MAKKKDSRTDKPAKRLNRGVFYSVLAIIVAAIGIFVPYTIICFHKNKTLFFDIEIFKSNTLWTWFGIVCGVVIVGVIAFSIYYDLFNHTKLLNKTEAAKSDIYGDSRFLNDKEIKELYGDYNFSELGNIDISGHLVRSERKNGKLHLSVVPKQHALITGVSGDGKSLRHLGVTIQLNAKSKTKPSMLINDIKGELWNFHSKFLKEQGYETILLDLRNPFNSYRLNPLNIIWQLKKEAEETQLELTDNELNRLYFIYKVFKGEISKKEFEETVNKNQTVFEEDSKQDIETRYNEYLAYIKTLNIKDFPGALINKNLKALLALPKKCTEGSETDKYAELYHLFLDEYKICFKVAAGVDRIAFYKEWQSWKFNKRMDKLNRASGLILELSRQIVPETTGENKQWSDGAQGICAAIITGMLEDGFSPELAFSEEMFTINQISNIVNRQRNELNNFLKLRDLDSKVFDFAGPILDNPAEKTVAGYMSNLQTPLRNYLEEGVEYIMSGTDIHFHNIVAKPTAIFLLIPEEFPTRNTIASMFITQIYNELLHQSNDFAEQNYLLPRPFYFLLDEFGNSVKIPTLPSWVTLCRSRNIFFAFYVQALSQIKTLYGENDMKTIVQNCHLQIIMGSNEQETIDHFQKNFGERTVVTRTANFDPKTSDIDFKGSSTLSKVDLVPPSHLRKIPNGTIYWKMHKVNPAKTHLELIFENTDILSIGAYDKPAETYKDYDKSARIYDIAARNKYVQELNALIDAETTDDDNNGDSDGGAGASIPTGFVEVTPEQLEEYNKQNYSDGNKKATPKGGGAQGGKSVHTQLLNFSDD